MLKSSKLFWEDDTRGFRAEALGFGVGSTFCEAKEHHELRGRGALASFDLP